jgi:hypothetical protein
MKEDIFERLHYHSGLVAQGCWDELDDYDREAIRRFGDLIVAECAGIAETAEPYQSSDLIKQHFGVKK